MAKWEDKDPKWIVQERQDGSNVNGVGEQSTRIWYRSSFRLKTADYHIGTGWHWEEKNQMSWSRQKLEDLLVGMLVDMSAAQGHAKVTLLKDLKGEALLTTRKGKKRFAMYDLTITLTWEGLWVEDNTKQVKGEIVIAEFASANDPDEYEWTVSAEGTGTAQDRLRSHVEGLRAPIFDRLQQYTSALNDLV